MLDMKLESNKEYMGNLSLHIVCFFFGGGGGLVQVLRANVINNIYTYALTNKNLPLIQAVFLAVLIILIANFMACQPINNNTKCFICMTIKELQYCKSY